MAVAVGWARLLHRGVDLWLSADGRASSWLLATPEPGAADSLPFLDLRGAAVALVTLPYRPPPGAVTPPTAWPTHLRLVRILLPARPANTTATPEAEYLGPAARWRPDSPDADVAEAWEAVAAQWATVLAAAAALAPGPSRPPPPPSPLTAIAATAAVAAPRDSGRFTVVSDLPPRFAVMRRIQVYASPRRVWLIGQVPPPSDSTASPTYRVLEFDRVILAPPVPAGGAAAGTAGGVSTAGPSGGPSPSPPPPPPAAAPIPPLSDITREHVDEYTATTINAVIASIYTSVGLPVPVACSAPDGSGPAAAAPAPTATPPAPAPAFAAAPPTHGSTAAGVRAPPPPSAPAPSGGGGWLSWLGIGSSAGSSGGTPTSRAMATPPAAAPAAATLPQPPPATRQDSLLSLDVVALLGVICLSKGYHLVVVTRRSRVGTIGAHPIYTIRDVELLPLFTTASQVGAAAVAAAAAASASGAAVPVSAALTGGGGTPTAAAAGAGGTTSGPGSSWMADAGRSLLSMLSAGLSVSSADAAAVAEGRYTSLLLSNDLATNFFFSYAYDLTLPLQRQVRLRVQHHDAVTAPPHRDDDDAARLGSHHPAMQWCWNRHLVETLAEGGVGVWRWCPPVIHGYFAQVTTAVLGNPLAITLLARRSSMYAGPRYLKRGVSEDGYCANEVETEQIADDTAGTLSAFVQLRASVPVYWMQRTNMAVPKPPIQLHARDPAYAPARHHVARCLARYGAPICCVNLVKKKEKVAREKVIGREFARAIAAINQQLPPPHRVQYLALDYAALVKSKRFNLLAALRDAGRWVAANTGLFATGRGAVMRLTVPPMLLDRSLAAPGAASGGGGGGVTERSEGGERGDAEDTAGHMPLPSLLQVPTTSGGSRAFLLQRGMRAMQRRHGGPIADASAVPIVPARVRFHSVINVAPAVSVHVAMGGNLAAQQASGGVGGGAGAATIPALPSLPLALGATAGQASGGPAAIAASPAPSSRPSSPRLAGRSAIGSSTAFSTLDAPAAAPAVATPVMSCAWCRSPLHHTPLPAHAGGSAPLPHHPAVTTMPYIVALSRFGSLPCVEYCDAPSHAECALTVAGPVAGYGAGTGQRAPWQQPPISLASSGAASGAGWPALALTSGVNAVTMRIDLTLPQALQVHSRGSLNAMLLAAEVAAATVVASTAGATGPMALRGAPPARSGTAATAPVLGSRPLRPHRALSPYVSHTLVVPPSHQWYLYDDGVVLGHLPPPARAFLSTAAAGRLYAATGARHGPTARPGSGATASRMLVPVSSTGTLHSASYGRMPPVAAPHPRLTSASSGGSFASSRGRGSSSHLRTLRDGEHDMSATAAADEERAATPLLATPRADGRGNLTSLPSMSAFTPDTTSTPPTATPAFGPGGAPSHPASKSSLTSSAPVPHDGGAAEARPTEASAAAGLGAAHFGAGWAAGVVAGPGADAAAGDTPAEPASGESGVLSPAAIREARFVAHATPGRSASPAVGHDMVSPAPLFGVATATAAATAAAAPRAAATGELAPTAGSDGPTLAFPAHGHAVSSLPAPVGQGLQLPPPPPPPPLPLPPSAPGAAPLALPAAPQLPELADFASDSQASAAVLASPFQHCRDSAVGAAAAGAARAVLVATEEQDSASQSADGNARVGLAVRIREYVQTAGTGDYIYANLIGTSHGYHNHHAAVAVTVAEGTSSSTASAKSTALVVMSRGSSVRSLSRALPAGDPVPTMVAAALAGCAEPATAAALTERLAANAVLDVLGGWERHSGDRDDEGGGAAVTTALVPLRGDATLPEGFRLQSGVARTNCVDCMDRTNVAQVCIGVHVYGIQLACLGLTDNDTLDPNGVIVRTLMDMYEEMGDAIALQYGGSEANKKVTTAEHATSIAIGNAMTGNADDDARERSLFGGGSGRGGGGGGEGGGWNPLSWLGGKDGAGAGSGTAAGAASAHAGSSRLGAGSTSEFLSSLQRFYANSFTDGVKQAGMNLLTGVYRPQRDAPPPVWELETDAYLHNRSLLPGNDVGSQERAAARRGRAVLADDEGGAVAGEVGADGGGGAAASWAAAAVALFRSRHRILDTRPSRAHDAALAPRLLRGTPGGSVFRLAALFDAADRLLWYDDLLAKQYFRPFPAVTAVPTPPYPTPSLPSLPKALPQWPPLFAPPPPAPAAPSQLLLADAPVPFILGADEVVPRRPSGLAPGPLSGRRSAAPQDPMTLSLFGDVLPPLPTSIARHRADRLRVVQEGDSEAGLADGTAESEGEEEADGATDDAGSVRTLTTRAGPRAVSGTGTTSGSARPAGADWLVTATPVSSPGGVGPGATALAARHGATLPPWLAHNPNVIVDANGSVRIVSTEERKASHHRAGHGIRGSGSGASGGAAGGAAAQQRASALQRQASLMVVERTDERGHSVTVTQMSDLGRRAPPAGGGSRAGSALAAGTTASSSPFAFQEAIAPSPASSAVSPRMQRYEVSPALSQGVASLPSTVAPAGDAAGDGEFTTLLSPGTRRPGNGAGFNGPVPLRPADAWEDGGDPFAWTPPVAPPPVPADAQVRMGSGAAGAGRPGGGGGGVIGGGANPFGADFQQLMSPDLLAYARYTALARPAGLYTPDGEAHTRQLDRGSAPAGGVAVTAFAATRFNVITAADQIELFRRTVAAHTCSPDDAAACSAWQQGMGVAGTVRTATQMEMPRTALATALLKDAATLPWHLWPTWAPTAPPSGLHEPAAVIGGDTDAPKRSPPSPPLPVAVTRTSWAGQAQDDSVWGASHMSPLDADNSSGDAWAWVDVRDYHLPASCAMAATPWVDTLVMGPAVAPLVLTATNGGAPARPPAPAHSHSMSGITVAPAAMMSAAASVAAAGASVATARAPVPSSGVASAAHVRGYSMPAPVPVR